MTSKDECSPVGELLPEYLAGRLSDSEESRVREHLDRCPDCRSRANAVSLLQQTPVPSPDPDRWEGFVRGVVTEAENSRGRGGRRRVWVLATSLAAAAVLVLMWLRAEPLGQERADPMDGLAREVAELPRARAAAWTTGLGTFGFMSPGFDASSLANHQIEQLVTEVRGQ